MTKNQDGIVNPHEHDVLSGRGNFVNYHSGNEHFRALVRKHKVAYVACPKPQKGKFSKLIYDEVRARDPPGRFLKQDPKTKLWCDIGEKKALDKTRQALREGAPEIQKELSGDDEYDDDDDDVSYNDSPGIESPTHQQSYSFQNVSSFPSDLAPPLGMPRDYADQVEGGTLSFENYQIDNTNIDSGIRHIQQLHQLQQQQPLQFLEQQKQMQQRQQLLQLQQQLQQQQQFQIQQLNQKQFQQQQFQQQQFQKHHSPQQISPQRVHSSMLPAVSSIRNVEGSRDQYTVDRSYSDSVAHQVSISNNYSDLKPEHKLNLENRLISNPSPQGSGFIPGSTFPNSGSERKSISSQINASAYSIQNQFESRPLIDPYSFGRDHNNNNLESPASPSSYQETEQVGPLPGRRMFSREKSGRRVYGDRQGSNSSLIVDNVFSDGRPFELVTSKSGRFDLSQHMSAMSLTVEEIDHNEQDHDDDDRKQLGSLLNASMHLSKKPPPRYPVKQVSTTDMGLSLSENNLSSHGGSILVGLDMSVATLGDGSMARMMTESQAEMSFVNVFDDTDKDPV